jgi:hypothetical protein
MMTTMMMNMIRDMLFLATGNRAMRFVGIRRDYLELQTGRYGAPNAE